MQPIRSLDATGTQRKASNAMRNLPATQTTPLRQPAPAPCPHCCGEGYLISQGPGYFDLQEECWMPDDDIDPCPTCHGSGRQPIDWNDPNHESNLLQPHRNQEPHADDDLPRLTF
jgi:hypothetical protein